MTNSPSKIVEVASLRGMAMGIAAYTLFSFHDMFVKALVYSMPAAQILFMRSIVIIALCFAFDRRHLVRDLLQSDNRLLILGRGLLTLAAWVMYYTAARDLQLAELTTLYYFAPVLTTVLAVIFLKEQVTLARVGAASIGFFGVIVAANPAGFSLSLPVVLVLMAALSWAVAMILMRKISKKDRAIVQVFAQNLTHAFAMGIFSLPFWQHMSPLEIGLCIGAGVVGGMGQFLLVETAKIVPASVLGTVEYGALIWAFVFGYVFFGEIPGQSVYTGAVLVILAGFLLAWTEHRSRRDLLRR